MKKFVTVLLVITLTVCLAGCGNSKSTSSNEKSTGKAEITFRLAELHTKGYPTTLADEKFAKLVNEKSKGRIKIEVYPDGVLGDEKSVIEQLQYGGIDFARVSSAPMAEFSKNLNALMLPYLYNDSEHMWKVLNGDLGKKMLESISSSGFVGLAWYDGGARNFYCNKEIKSLKDMKGLKIRVQDSKLMFALIEALGAVPSSMPQGDVYSAVQSGVLHGAENNIPTYESFSQDEVAKYYILDGHTRVPEILAGSATSLKKLSKEDQDLIKECAKETQEYQIKEWASREESSRKTVEADGAKFIELSEETLKEFRKVCEPLYDKFGAEYKDIIDQIKEAGK